MHFCILDPDLLGYLKTSFSLSVSALADHLSRLPYQSNILSSKKQNKN
jgi:hypothetical protein